MPKIWRGVVKSQLRGLDIKDIYDYYDFNYSIEERSAAIKDEILRGDYRSNQPLIIKVEKKLGVCRHLIIPQPTDALVMQTITEFIHKRIEDKQPSKNAFYSRDRHSVGLPHHILEEGEYSKNWKKMWKSMQKKIFKFKESKELIIVTDLTNYFDSINLVSLREHIISLSNKDDEVLIDLLFRVIEDLSWNPDYLPYKKHGLPTINIESIRLLGHSFLFELDLVLKKKTKDSFARWMDDITIAIDNKNNATKILSDISDILKSRGLALNLSKTNLLSVEDFEFNFLIEQNKFLDDFDLKKSIGSNDKKELRARFKQHLKNRKPLHWAKVTKRFITAFSKNKINILDIVNNLYLDSPNVRSSLCVYMSIWGYSTKSKSVMLNILENIALHDDVSLFYLSKVITDWNIPNRRESLLFLERVYGLIFNKLSNPFNFYCLIWIKSKYDTSENLFKIIKKYEPLWKKNFFIRRQVIAVLSRLYTYNKEEVSKMLNLELSSGMIDSISVSNTIITFSNLEILDFKINSYLFPKKLSVYSLQRFLVLCSVLNSENIRSDKNVQMKIKSFIKDSFQKKILREEYKIKI